MTPPRSSRSPSRSPGHPSAAIKRFLSLAFSAAFSVACLLLSRQWVSIAFYYQGRCPRAG